MTAAGWGCWLEPARPALLAQRGKRNQLKTSGTQSGWACFMKPFAWSPEKKAQLISDRELCFEAVVVAIEAGELLDVLEHPKQDRYPGQRILVVRIDGYVHLVPYVEAADHLFLKTIIPSRKAQRDYETNTNTNPSDGESDA